MHATTSLYYHSLHTVESIWIVSLCRHLFAGWAVSKECMVLVCTLHRRRGLPGPFIERWKWCKNLGHQQVPPLAAPFFPTKAIRENPHRWTWGRGMMDGTDVFFSAWGLQSGSICGTVPQFCKTSPHNRSVFGRKKTEFATVVGSFSTCYTFFLKTNIAPWK